MQRIGGNGREGESMYVDDAAPMECATMPARPRFRPKVLPLMLATLVGFGGAAILATRVRCR